jgi:hypothetical protein
VLTDNLTLRELASRYGYQPKDSYILFELSVESAFSTIYLGGGTGSQSISSAKQK